MAGTGLAFAVELWAVLRTTRHHFRYSLDDPYIHLALAQQIGHGHYGIDAGQAASPSSSVLWPFLLAPLTWLPGAELWPLLVNLLCTLATVWVLLTSLRTELPEAVAGVVTAGAVLGLNLVGLAFTGMEHSLQVLLAVLVGTGVVTVVRHDRVPALLVPAMALGPLVRYENASFSVAAALVLVASGHWRRSLAGTCVWLSGVLVFAVFLLHLGLDPLPSSVLAKSPYSRLPLGEVVRGHLALSADQPAVVLLLAVLLADAMVQRRWTRLHSFVGIVVGGHVLAGDYGWFGRYEVYLLAGALPVVVTWARGWHERARGGGVALMATLGTATLAGAALAPLAEVTLQTPAAARDIWSQQSQTAAFVAEEWRGPVAVNDLGLVSYRSDQPVLDLWGLADGDARRARLSGTDPDWMAERVDEAGVRLVAVYPSWFPDLPRSWTLVGRIEGVRPVSSGEQVVDLYVVDRSDAARVCRLLDDFAARTESEDTRVSCAL